VHDEEDLELENGREVIMEQKVDHKTIHGIFNKVKMNVHGLELRYAQ
jgi:hypothetical protein